MSPRYPVHLDLHRRPCLVVGGGAVAARKVEGLLAAGAAVTVCAPEVVPPLRDHADAGRVEWRRERAGSVPDAPGAQPWAFVVVATDDPVTNRTLAEEATAAHIWANDASDPVGGPAALPAVWRDGPLTVTVSTGGVHPGAAAWARDRAAEAIGSEPAVALQLLAELSIEAPRTRPSWQAAVESGMLESIRAGHVAEAKERLEACLSSSSD